VSAAQAVAQSPTLVPGAGSPVSADALDLSVAENNTLRVAAAETLGHYADWLQLPASRLRALNNLTSRTPVLLGRQLKLDFARVDRVSFEQRRRDYHQRLQAEYFSSNRIIGTEVYLARRGDSLWSVTQRNARLPIWLLQQYNPDVDFNECGRCRLSCRGSRSVRTCEPCTFAQAAPMPIILTCVLGCTSLRH
jgi:membrane-bound lytic murein transglycosylase D